jgi:hypothetical protein
MMNPDGCDVASGLALAAAGVSFPSKLGGNALAL